MKTSDTSRAGFFEAKYKSSRDPWDFARSSYEQSRYDAILAALSHRRYMRCFEPGCSIGALTERLATICEVVEAFDFSPTAIDIARERNQHLPNVCFSCRPLEDSLPLNSYDLVVFSEIGYYLSASAWAEFCGLALASMSAGTVLLGAHWLGESSEHQISGDEVHEILGGHDKLRLEYSRAHDAFRLDRWTVV